MVPRALWWGFWVPRVVSFNWYWMVWVCSRWFMSVVLGFKPGWVGPLASIFDPFPWSGSSLSGHGPSSPTLRNISSHKQRALLAVPMILNLMVVLRFIYYPAETKANWDYYVGPSGRCFSCGCQKGCSSWIVGILRTCFQYVHYYWIPQSFHQVLVVVYHKKRKGMWNMCRLWWITWDVKLAKVWWNGYCSSHSIMSRRMMPFVLTCNKWRSIGKRDWPSCK